MLLILAQSDTWLHSPWFVYPALVAAGFIAGIVNTIAGGGSFLTLPVLMYVAGLDPKIANGTNRIAILTSSAVAARVFHQHGLIDKKALPRMLVPLLIGSPCGALLAAHLPQDVFRGVFGALFLLMAVFFCLRPQTLLKTDRKPKSSPVAEVVMFLFIGLYVGFIQAGFGLLMLVGMGLFHARELLNANALKNVMGFLVTLIALIVFLFAGQVHWLPGLVMAGGNLIGGYVGAHLALRRGQNLIFIFMIVVMVATGIKLLIEAF